MIFIHRLYTQIFPWMLASQAKQISFITYLDNKSILDFGSGTSANCLLCEPDFYLGIEPDRERIG
jgi:hypothetical protein